MFTFKHLTTLEQIRNIKLATISGVMILGHLSKLDVQVSKIQSQFVRGRIYIETKYVESARSCP